MKPSLSDSELLVQIGAYESAVDALLTIVEEDSASEEVLAQATTRLSEFASLLERLEEGHLPTGSEFQSKLKSARLKHSLLSSAATERQTEVGEALTKLRETRKKTGFYGATGSEVGASCDMSG